MRKTKDMEIPLDNRDKGKIFRIREMSAAEAEWWAMRALMCLQKAGTDVGDAQSMPMNQLAVVGIQALFKLNPDDIKPLLDQMWKSVTIVPDRANMVFDRPLLEEDIEEVTTRLLLRAEVIALHTGFSMPDVSSILQTSEKSSTDSKTTRTSPARSGRLSAVDRRR